MKKFVGLLLIVVISFILVGCNESEQNTLDLDGFHYIFNETGDYIWLGMPRRDVERIIGSDSDHVPDSSDDILLSISEGLALWFYDDEDESLVIIDVRIRDAAFEPRWFARGGITVGSSSSEVETHFGVDPIAQPGFMAFYFMSDHTLNEGTMLWDSAYWVSFSFYEDSSTVSSFSLSDMTHW